MNIFVTDPSPHKSARVLPDKHIVKMPLETCQMLAIVCSDKWGHNFGRSGKDTTPFAREMPDEFKYDDGIDTFTAYKMYIASKPWVCDNYLRLPHRKPDWI